MEFTVREHTTADEFRTTISLLLELNGGDPILYPDKMTEDFLTAIKFGYHHFGIYNQSELIGTMSLSMRYNPTFYKPGCELNGLIIDERYRSKGLGRKAMDFATQWAKENGAGFMRLFVYPANEKAISFYEELGYRHTSNYMFKNLMAE